MVYSSVVGHSAFEILSSGSMSSGNYSFPDSVFVGDNVGIGTINPGYALNTIGTIRSQDERQNS